MNPKLILCLALVLSGDLFGCATTNSHSIVSKQNSNLVGFSTDTSDQEAQTNLLDPSFDITDPDAQTKQYYARAKQYFENYLNDCGTNQIQCLWFLQDQVEVGMVMTINLNKETADTWRDVYGWAIQSMHTRVLSDSQKLSLKQIVNDLPPSDKNIEFSHSVFVSIRRDNQVKVFQYNRHQAPAVIRHIYDIGGGYLEDKD